MPDNKLRKIPSSFSRVNAIVKLNHETKYDYPENIRAFFVPFLALRSLGMRGGALQPAWLLVDASHLCTRLDEISTTDSIPT